MSSPEQVNPIVPFVDYDDYRLRHSMSLPHWACRFVPEARLGKQQHDYKNRLGYRTEFQRDRDDILYSPSFRQLAYKRQMFSGRGKESFYTRLTHTLIVSQLARSIAKGLCLDEYLTEAIALGHDLGHTPYGHSGEDGVNVFLNEQLFPTVLQTKGLVASLKLTLRERLENEKELIEKIPKKIPGQMELFEQGDDFFLDELERLFYCRATDRKIFSHNRQSYRVVKYLEKGTLGLQLTMFACYGIIRATGSAKDSDDFELPLENLDNSFASYEAQVVRLSDDIAWANHDLTEDCRQTGREPQGLLKKYFDDFGEAGLENHPDDVRRWLSMEPGERYGLFVTDLIDTNKDKLTPGGFRKDESEGGWSIKHSPQVSSLLTDMKNVVIQAVHNSPDVKSISEESKENVKRICEFISEEEQFRKLVNNNVFRRRDVSKLTRLEKLRAIADAVTYLSDSQADAFYNEHLGSYRAPDNPDQKKNDQLPWGYE